MSEPKRVLYWGPGNAPHLHIANGRRTEWHPHEMGAHEAAFCATIGGRCAFTPATVSGGLTEEERVYYRAGDNDSSTLLSQLLRRLDSDIAILKAKLEEAERAKPILIPLKIDYHNANTDRCDVLNAPCACGTRHTVEDMLERLWELNQRNVPYWRERAHKAEARVRELERERDELWRVIRFVQSEAERLKQLGLSKSATCGQAAHLRTLS